MEITVKNEMGKDKGNVYGNARISIWYDTIIARAQENQ